MIHTRLLTDDIRSIPGIWLIPARMVSVPLEDYGWGNRSPISADSDENSYILPVATLLLILNLLSSRPDHPFLRPHPKLKPCLIHPIDAV